MQKCNEKASNQEVLGAGFCGCPFAHSSVDVRSIPEDHDRTRDLPLNPKIANSSWDVNSFGGRVMARINIEDQWWTDPRRSKLIKLVGDEYMADGLAVRMWRLAQEFWGRNRSLVPTEIFETLEEASKLIEAKLAEVHEDGVYVRGSSQFLDWHFEKREAGRKGGKASGETRRKKSTKDQQVTGSKPEAKRSKRKQTQPSDSGSHSDSDSGSGSSSVSTVEDENPSDSKPQAFVASYCEQFKRRWKVNPTIQGKDAGIATRLANHMSHAKFCTLLEAFFQMPDAWLVKTKHPFAAFETKLNEITVFAESGNFTTQRQAIQADDMASNHLLMEKLKREGR